VRLVFMDKHLYYESIDLKNNTSERILMLEVPISKWTFVHVTHDKRLYGK
jgi:hypothetical protein